MSDRSRHMRAAPGALEAMLGLEKYLKQCGLDEKLMLLVKLRASIINGCTYCVDMHSRDARLAGESERRVHAVGAWEDSPVFSEREKAAFAWADALTNIATTHAPDDVYERVRAQFDDKELADLTLLVGAINTWNRISIGFRTPPPASWPPLPPG